MAVFPTCSQSYLTAFNQFEDSSLPVLSTSPGDEDYLPLFHVKNVSSGNFDSAEAVEETASTRARLALRLFVGDTGVVSSTQPPSWLP